MIFVRQIALYHTIALGSTALSRQCYVPNLTGLLGTRHSIDRSRGGSDTRPHASSRRIRSVLFGAAIA